MINGRPKRLIRRSSLLLDRIATQVAVPTVTPAKSTPGNPLITRQLGQTTTLHRLPTMQFLAARWQTLGTFTDLTTGITTTLTNPQN
jgi:hypothetical protein